MTLWLLTALLGCSQQTASMADAGLPTSVMEVAGAEAEQLALDSSTVDGVRWFQGLPDSRPVVVLTLSDTATPGEVTVWSQRVRAAMAARTSIPVEQVTHPSAVAFVFDAAVPLPPEALGALASLPMDDVSISSTLLNRPDGLGPVNPDALRELHAMSTARSHIAVRSTAAPSAAHEERLAALPAGGATDQPENLDAIMAMP